jgi:hypothetical protein
MRTLFRSLILWLALLAVPFQGFAAATMLPCAPATNRSAADAHGMQAADGAGHGHAAMHKHAAAAGHAASDSGAGQGHHASAKCGTCAACCIGAAMAPAPTLAVASIAPQSVSIPFDAGHLPTVHPTLPERPPRSSLA